MFNSLKNFFTKTFQPQKEKITNQEFQPDKKEIEEISSTSSFEPSYIEPSSESVIKRTQRTLKYRH